MTVDKLIKILNELPRKDIEIRVIVGIHSFEISSIDTEGDEDGVYIYPEMESVE